MSKQTKLGIGWCHYTWNLWEGCWKVSPGCENCYAEAKNVWLKRGANWGRTAPRHFFKPAHYDQPFKWDQRAREENERYRVFVGSVMDVLEIHPDPAVNHFMNNRRQHLWDVVEQCDHLDFLLLTKRIENAAQLLPWIRLDCDPPKNVWIGTTVENDAYAGRRLPTLRRTRAHRRFVSYEPALGAVKWRHHLGKSHPTDVACPTCDAWQGWACEGAGYGYHAAGYHPKRVEAAKELGDIHQVIFGDESGRSRRPAELAWAEDTRKACAETDTSFYFKQWHGADGKKVHLPVLDGKTYREFPS